MRWTLFGLPLLLLGCWGQGEEPPGEAIGAFNAVGFLVEQSCGAAIPAPDPLDLDFELRSEFNGRAYWRLLGGSMFAGVEEDGKLVVIYSPHGLNDTAHTEGCCCCGGNEIENSLAVNINIFVYALLH